MAGLKRNRNIFVHLEGGLGNQLFQYAAGRALAASLNAEIHIDSATGFLFDYRYRRKFELSRFSIATPKASVYQRLPFLILRCSGINLFSIARRLLQEELPYFYLEPSFEYSPPPVTLHSLRSVWMSGYWQCELYFKRYEEIIRTELDPPIPSKVYLRSLGERMRRQNSVAVGIRLYEESNNPNAHCRDGRVKTPGEVSMAIERLQSMHENLHFYVFCTHKASFISELRLPTNTIILTPNMGYSDATDTLWLLSQCRHHILTNSSLYWWGAWLSSSNHEASNQTIMAADNFINQDSLCSHWLPF